MYWRTKQNKYRWLEPEICMRKAKVQIHKKSLYRRIRSDSRSNQRASAITIVTTKLK